MRKLIAVSYSLITGVTLALLLFRAGKLDYYLKPVFMAGNIRLLLFALLCTLPVILLLPRFGRGIESFLEEHTLYLMPVALIFLLAGELIFVRAFFFYQDWDPLAVLSAVYETLHGEAEKISIGYFSAHPNNLALVALYLGILKLAAFFGSESVLIVAGAQCVLLTVSAFLVFRILRWEGCSYLCSWGAFFLFCLWIGFSPWIVTTYSDMTGLIFPLLFIRLFQVLSAERLKLSLLYVLWALTGILGASGYAIKPQTAIFLIAAVLLYAFVCLSERRDFKWLPIFLVSFILAHVLLSMGLSRVLPVKLDKDQSFSAVHYFMMGLNEETDGVYSNDDTEYTASFDDPKKRRAADLELAKERLKAFGFKGLVSHLEKKQLVNFGDGTFSWGIDGDFFAGKEVEGLPAVKETRLTPALEDWLFTAGRHYLLYSSIRQGLWLLILFFCLPAGIGLKRYSDAMSAAALSAMGLIAFELIFEAKARYLLIFTPVFLILAILGMQVIFQALSPEGAYRIRSKRKAHKSMM